MGTATASSSVVAFVAAAFATGAAQSARPPTGNWNVNFADAQCVAHRDYGSSEKPLRLLIKAPPVGDVVQLAVLKEASSSEPEQQKATVRVDGGPPLETKLLAYTRRASGDRIFLLNMTAAEFAPVWRAKTLTVRSMGLTETFALSGMEPLLKVIDECVADLRRVFNIGSAGTDPTRFKRRARGNIAKLFSSDDYPGVAVMKGESGRVGFALLIGEDGRVADCTIVSTSGIPTLDSQACALLTKRVRVEPALDVQGKPTKDSAVGAIVWRIP